MSSVYSEDALVEQPAIHLFSELEWETYNAFHEFDHGASPLGRENKGQVVLTSRLLPALEKLNPDLPNEAFVEVVNELLRDRSKMSPAQANREVYDCLKNGVQVNIQSEDGGTSIEKAQVIDWNNPDNNDFLLASQFWITGEMYTRRPDLIGFVNGLPLVFIELKATHENLKTAYTDNLTDYRDTIPHVFWYNAFIILSNGSKSVIGSSTASWEHFAEWKKINSEGEEGVISLETIIKGTCEKTRVLDLVENYTLFMEAQGGLIKLLGKNHQYLGVENVLDAFDDIQSREGRLGVFWHTQGSGKSISMIFFSQKMLRKIPGDWTFVIVTDRHELDKQIYKNFVSTGTITEKQAQAESSKHLRQLLTQNHRYVFTLIHKFRTEQGEEHPTLSERSDIIVIVDEAHRTQYDTLALNMRTALPNASFIAFTGTPLISSEEKTRDVFGEYVSIYNFKQSVDDKATVPLYYENRIPALQLTNENLNEEMELLLEEAELDEEQEKKVEQEFSRQHHLITRDDRLETIAEDIVSHFLGRGFDGKAMVISIDKATAVKMYDKVQVYWQKAMSELMDEIAKAMDDEKQEQLKQRLSYIQETDMAVVVSQSQNEIQDMQKKGLDIAPHRKRMVSEDLDTMFKDSDNPFRIVFVCAMWLTGFDAPACSTIYLDKPMRNHTLMQTIARANRVFRDKVNGLIVDYVGVFRSLQKALSIYGASTAGGSPVIDKDELVSLLKESLSRADAFCKERGINLETILTVEPLEKIKLLDDAVEATIVNDESKKQYITLSTTLWRLYKAVLPAPKANELAPMVILHHVIAKKITSLAPSADISEVMDKVEKLLDESIEADGYLIQEPEEDDPYVDLSAIDFDALKDKFSKGKKRTEAEKLKGAINSKLKAMVRLNPSRMDYLKKFQEMIDEYNNGAITVEELFSRFLRFTDELNEEEKRHISEQLTEEELSVFDILTKPEMDITEKERKQLKKIAHDLLETLRREKLVLDWRKHQTPRAAVRVAIEDELDQLPECYGKVYQQKCDAVYLHVYECYYGEERSVYS